MNPVNALSKLRARGFTVTLEGLSGAPVRDPRAMESWLAENWPGVALALRIEQHAAVKLAQQVFPGARLVEVRPARAASPVR